MELSEYICAHCKKPIEGDAVIKALGKTWHKEHFLCAHCKKPLKDAKYIEKDGKAYCEEDWKSFYHKENDPVCAQCNKPIADVAVKALGKSWHKEHFVCFKCKKPFSGRDYFVENGKPYCKEDYTKLFPNKNQDSDQNPICNHCNKPITGPVTVGMGKKWHKEHFMCYECKNPFNGATFYVQDGKPYCEKDHKKLFQNGFKAVKNPICAYCNKPITDTVVIAMDKTWHREHFMCTHCKNPFNGTPHLVEDGKPYCELDYNRLFKPSKKDSDDKPICAHCNKPIAENCTQGLGKNWHREHFMCSHCKKPFNGEPYLIEDDKPYCVADHKKLFPAMYRDSKSNPICAHCNEAISETVLTALGKHWHIDHFVCAKCKTPITYGQFRTHEGLPYCENDCNILFGKKCSKCNEIIKHTVLTAMNKHWHKECFSCQKCKKAIDVQKGFIKKDGSPFCIGCA